jgi:hypothetical protein
MESLLLDPVKRTIKRPSQRPYIVCNQQQSERQHPEPEKRENTGEATDDEQHTR